jgi:LmbE family N-acetylglucosaminyl deacetylase
MLTLPIAPKPDSPLRVLCLGAHSDDIEIGCGGTILKLIDTYRDAIEFCWVVFSGSAQRAAEASASAGKFLHDVAKKNVILKNFRDGYFPYIGGEIKDVFEWLKPQFAPDIVLTHYRNDRHQDHRTISDLTWNTYRNHFILEYEVPKFDGDLGSPNYFVTLPSRIFERKNAIILESFSSQSEKHWLTQDTLTALLRLRGIETGGTGTHAEAFYARKLTW